MQTSGGLGIRPAHMPQAAPPSPAALPRASGIRFWKPSLQAGSLTLPGTLEAASLPLPIPPTLTLARLAQSATLEGYLLLFCVFFSWAQNKAGRVPKNGCSGGPAWRCRRWRCMSDPHTIHRFSPAVRQKCFLPSKTIESLLWCAPLESRYYFFSLRGIRFPYWNTSLSNSRMIASCLR